MGLEAATYIHQLNPANPVGAVDPKAQGDDHLRLIKSAIQATFPNITGAMTQTQAMLNALPAITAFAAPSVDIDVIAPNIGSFSSVMRSDARLRLSQAIAPAWTGQHTWSQPLRGAAGSAGTPTYSFVLDPDTGLYNAGANEIGVSLAGSVVWYFTGSASINRATQLQGGVGAVATPTYSFETDPNTGIYLISGDRLGICSGGVLRVDISNVVEFNVRTLHNDGAVGTPGICFSADTDTGFYRAGANKITWAGNATAGGNLSAQGVEVIDGTLGAPSLSFASDLTTGFRRKGAGNVGYSAAGAETFTFETAANGGATVADYGGALQTVGFRNIPQNIQAANYQCVLADSGKHIYHASGAGAGDTYTIPANGTVAFPIGTAITFVNDDSNAVSIAITTDTLALAGSALTGTRTLAATGVATALKVTATRWIISGTGLS